MRSAVCLLLIVLAFILVPVGFSQERERAPFRDEMGAAVRRVPAPPLPFICPAVRGKATTEPAWRRVEPLSGNSNREIIALPLSAGLSVVSIPLRTESESLADLFPTLPAGSRAWTWDSSAQAFVEGLDQKAPFGTGFWLYLSVPTVLLVEGEINASTATPFELRPGWNLVGVPYNLPLWREAQRVYVNHAKTTIDDAIEVGAIGEQIYSFDVSGYEAVIAGGQFQPLHGYWVWSKEAQLLEMVPASGLGGPGAAGSPLWGTALGWAGQGLVGQTLGFGVSTLLFSMGLGNDASIMSKLDEIDGKLNTVISNQQAIALQLTSLLAALNLNTDKVLEEIQHGTMIQPVENTLQSHYDQPNPELSLKWFDNMAKAGKGTCTSATSGDCVTEAMRNNFANSVLFNWDITTNGLNKVHGAIIDSRGRGYGILDRFANIAFAPSTTGTLKDRYKSLEIYFSRLIGLQIKCGTLIMNAYVQHTGTAAEALQFKTGTFDPVIREEIAYFRDLVERIAVAKLVLPATATQPAVAVPAEMQAEGGMLWSLDYLMANMLGEPAGLRVRVITSPDINERAVQYGSSSSKPLPPLSQWSTIPGGEGSGLRSWRYPLYDSWSYAGTFPNGTRQFRFTPDWKVTSTILPVGQGTWGVNVGPGPSGLKFWGDTAASQTANVQLYDIDGDEANPPAGGATPRQAFGSMTIAARPDASYMLNPCLDQNVRTKAKTNGAVTNPSATGNYPSPCHMLSIHSNYASGEAVVGVSVPFSYVGDLDLEGSIFLNYDFRDDCGDSRGWWYWLYPFQTLDCQDCPRGSRTSDSWGYRHAHWATSGTTVFGTDARQWWTNTGLETFSLCYVGLTFKHALVCPYDNGGQGCTQR